MIPAIVIHTHLLLSDWMGGRCFGPLILIRPSQRDRIALRAHELEHARQWWWLATPCLVLAVLFNALPLAQPVWPWSLSLGVLGLIVQAPLYLLLRSYRMWAEVRAYQVTLSYAPAGSAAAALERAAVSLASHYWLQISPSCARMLLEEGRQPWWRYWRVPRLRGREAGEGAPGK
ncbi:hypothetical protein [Chitinolyticbacter meiyuanensis]|uniref:hypothetical protein n=1 Tax=Chitinolyticbacter meiyuanensis TaxID=682798 RepID=UPI0011E5C279|nr:hypothetical protein [Chitinolyticbacter meiyuanensis]